VRFLEAGIPIETNVASRVHGKPTFATSFFDGGVKRSPAFSAQLYELSCT
jgi:hypothetical protein